MAKYLAHNISRVKRINCDTEKAALFEIDRIEPEPDGPWVRPGDHWQILRLSGWRVGSGKLIHHGIGPRTAA